MQASLRNASCCTGLGNCLGQRGEYDEIDVQASSWRFGSTTARKPCTCHDTARYCVSDGRLGSLAILAGQFSPCTQRPAVALSPFRRKALLTLAGPT